MKFAILVAALLVATSAAAESIELVDSSFKLMRTGQTIEEWSWQAELYNTTDEPLRCRVKAELLDAGGFIVVTDSEEVIVKPGQEATVRGQTITGKPSGIVGGHVRVSVWEEAATGGEGE